ncbi:hypothetical protein GLOTRDRAFT_116357 [Gloeophyllum trabeum ATCC 11539]|uniref:REM-1 domain-containing protein n=1 Tax=Gloeophyllum trabeum (strain ATCC 11539 / FP-39264 / Madison 617) TaxID=670483 RepID=S7Q4N9_GLOTA|nr:uncharacterized protein GLOTRDRAFT_116357 [Gloeophyllum trabeum ATCC 11539]EPQ54453.1 hypothetical protein GLOTRDRAFT_116357 [Gloeophyllum trabeum ATCC 11539]
MPTAQPTLGVDRLSGTTVRHPSDAGSNGSRSFASGTTLMDGHSSGGNISNGIRSEDDDKPEQLEVLAKRLEVQKQIKEGAESMLQLALTDPNFKEHLRDKVQSELERAQNEIETITAQIRLISARPARPRQHSVEERDDFHTALNHAITCIRTLASLGRASGSQSPSPSTSTTKPSPSTELEIDAARVDAMNRLVGILQRNLRVRYAVNISEVVHVALLGLSDRCSKQCRACAYRLIRHALVDSDSIARLQEQPLDWYLVKSLARDNKHAVEKEQAVKLIRAIVEIGTMRRSPSTRAGSGSVPLSDGVMRAFIAIAEQPEDPLRLACLETLAEILLIDIDLMSRTGGIRLLLHVLAEGPLEVAPILASVFLHVVDIPRTRKYLHPGTDFEIALSGVTDAYGKGPEHDERMRACAKIIVMLLRTWSGLMYFSMGNMLAIRTIIDTLRIPSLDSREIIIDMFFDLLNIKPPEWHQTFIDGRRLTKPESLKLTDQYISLLILVFTKAGLLDALTSMFEESTTGSSLSRKATLLMAEVLQLANRLLPLSQAAKIQSIPRVFDLASDYGRGEHRIIGSLALSALDSFNRNSARLHPTANLKNNRPRANSGEDAVRRGQRQVEQVKLKMGMQMDDRTFQAALLETQVMLTKDHTKWSFETLEDLVEGPLRNPKRMEEAIKVSRFIRKLMSFFHPFSHRFSDIPRTKGNHRWVRLGCTLLNTLLESPDGRRFLESEDEFLKQIVKCFAQLDPFNSNGTLESDPIFSKARVQDTLTYGYLEMLGTLSAHEKGVELMEKFKIFTAFYHLSDTRSRDDLIKGIIQHLDYSIDGHSRIVLSKALTSSYVHIRMFATTHLGGLLGESAKANAWTLRLLLTQLYDPAMEVCELAVQYLQETCESMEILRLVVEMQPTLDHLGEIGHPLLMKFMSTPVGFRYLFDAGYIDREIDMWFHERNSYYVVQIEVYLAKAFNAPTVEESAATGPSDISVPRHFYGEMTKTELGCQVLHEKGHFAEFADFIRQHGLESEDTELIIKLKSILWAVGNIGATEGGLPFLEEEEIIPSILEIAEKSPVLTVRGTCFFVLGLLSATPQGAEILDDYQWESTLSPTGFPTGLCVPIDLEKFIFVPSWDTPTTSLPGGQLIPPTSQNENEVMTAIHNLANTVIANQASRTLARLKTKLECKEVFSSPAMFYRALHTISTHRYRLPVRRYILDLFDVELDYDLAKQLSRHAESLQAPPTDDRSTTTCSSRVVSVLGIPGRTRRGSDSDEEDLEEVAEVPVPVEPVMNLRPLSRIVGFE